MRARHQKFFYLFISTAFPLFALPSASAQDSNNLEGLVQNDSTPIEKVIIKNISNNRISTSDKKGIFNITTEIGDTLVLSHLGMKDLIVFINKSHLEEKPFIFNMTRNSIALDEVKLEKKSEINAVSLGIISEEIEELTPNERRLKTAGDFKWIHLLGLLGGHLEIDPILNKINGRTKRLKHYIELDKKEANIDFLEKRFYDYMCNEANIPEDDIGGFLYYLADQESLQGLIDQKQEGQLKFFILEWWAKYKDQLKQE